MPPIRADSSFLGLLPDRTEGAELRALARGAADRIEVPPPKLCGAAPTRAFNLLKKLEPDIKQGDASFVCDRRLHSGMV
jgi:hypothetical protein